jgi:hypothetical protein
MEIVHFCGKFRGKMYQKSVYIFHVKFYGSFHGNPTFCGKKMYKKSTLGVKNSVSPSILLNSIECSPLGVKKG